jgi:hypothetical protein
VRGKNTKDAKDFPMSVSEETRRIDRVSAPAGDATEKKNAKADPAPICAAVVRARLLGGAVGRRAQGAATRRERGGRVRGFSRALGDAEDRVRRETTPRFLFRFLFIRVRKNFLTSPTSLRARLTRRSPRPRSWARGSTARSPCPR